MLEGLVGAFPYTLVLFLNYFVCIDGWFWPAVLCLVTQLCLNLWDPMDCSLPASSVHGDSPGKNWSGLPYPPLGDLLNPGIESRSPMLQGDSLPSEPLGKPKKFGIGSLSILWGILPTQDLHGIFLTQEWNQGLLHFRKILYQLSYQGSPSSGPTPLLSTFWFLGVV